MTLSLTPPTLEAIRTAREGLSRLALQTPLIRRDLGGTEVWLKLETLQPIGSFKIRGAGNAIRIADPALLQAGVVTASAGNMGQGVAWCARAVGVPCSVVVPDHAPATKLAALGRLGATVIPVPFEQWWRVLEARATDLAPGFFVHPVSDAGVIAGNGTIGLEILEDLPEVGTVLVPYGGGGLSCGIAAAMRALGSEAEVVAVEPETAAPLAAAWRAGHPVESRYAASFVDGAGGRSVLPEMWPLARQLLQGAETVTLDQVAEAIRFLAENARVIAEGAGALSVAAAARRARRGPVVCVVSGGNIDAPVLAAMLGGKTPA